MKAWTDFLSDEDLAFVKRFVLASGSLKEMAKAYGISYPTVRLRLDRLIQKIKLLEDQQITSDFERIVRLQCTEGKLDAASMRVILAAHQAEMERHHEASDRRAEPAAV